MDNSESAAAASAVVTTSSGGHSVQRARRSRRRAEVSLTADAEEEVARKVARTLRNSHSRHTITSYRSYCNSIHEWYAVNNPSVCDTDGLLQPELFEDAISTEEGLIPRTVSRPPHLFSSPAYFLPSPRRFQRTSEQIQTVHTNSHARKAA